MNLIEMKEKIDKAISMFESVDIDPKNVNVVPVVNKAVTNDIKKISYSLQNSENNLKLIIE